MCAISCAPKLARKCEIEPWIPRGADGRAGGVRSRDYQTLWDGQISLAIGLRSRAWSSAIKVISIYTLSDLGDLSNLIGSLSRTIQQYSPPSSVFFPFF